MEEKKLTGGPLFTPPQMSSLSPPTTTKRGGSGNVIARLLTMNDGMNTYNLKRSFGGETLEGEN